MASSRIALAAIAVLASAVPDIHAAVVFDAPGHVCVEGTAPLARGASAGSVWTLCDWRGRTLATDIAAGADGVIKLEALPAGYYHLRCGNEDATFAVVPRPESRVFDHSSFYGVDSAQSWISRKGAFLCAWNGGDTYRTVSDLIRLAGVPHVRERLGWREVNRGPDKPPVLGHYLHNARLLHERGILVSGMFHDAPDWAGRCVKLPLDLAAVHRFCSQIAVGFGERMGDWEFWNEPDIGYAPEPVWDYAAALKAAFLGFKAARPDMPVLPGALCQKPDSPYAAVLSENDAAKFGDVFNYHVYEPIAQYPGTFAAIRENLRKAGVEGRAIWVTECSTHFEGHAKKQSVKPGAMMHSPEQELVLAEFYPKAQVALQMAGVSRSYHFVFGAYNEANGAKDWGVMRRDGTVKVVYAAIGTMTRELVSARLVGEIKVGDGLRAYLFAQPDGSQTVAFWSLSPVDTAKSRPNIAARNPISAQCEFRRAMSLAAPDGAYRLTDLCGLRSTATAKDGALELEATRYPAYVSGLHGLKADVQVQPCGRVMPYVVRADEDLSVVVRVEFDKDDFEISGQKTQAVLKGDTGRVRVFVWNLGDTAKTGRVEVVGAKLRGLPSGPFALGPRGSAPATFDCVLVPEDGGSADTSLVLTGIFGGRRSSRFYAPLLLERRYLAELERVPVEWSSPGAWRRNTSSRAYSAAFDEAEQAMRFDFGWTDPSVDRWFYPVHELSLPRESLEGARMIEFEVKAAQDKVENDFVCQNLMLVYADRAMEARVLPYNPPIGKWERRYVALDDGMDLAEVKAIRLGANPKGMKCTFWIRNLAIFRGKGK